MKKMISCLMAALMMAALLVGCGQQEPNESANNETVAPALEDGVYTADFNTDSSMFHANETCDGKGVLTVQDGQMTIHVSLASTSIVNLFPGLKEDAQKDGAVLLQPTTDTVTYPDGLTEEVNGFDIPVPALDEEFDVALIGKKGFTCSYDVLQLPFGDVESSFGINLGTTTVINFAHAHDLAIQYWTVNAEKDMEYLASVGADALITDYPDRAAKILSGLR